MALREASTARRHVANVRRELERAKENVKKARLEQQLHSRAAALDVRSRIATSNTGSL